VKEKETEIKEKKIKVSKKQKKSKLVSLLLFVCLFQDFGRMTEITCIFQILVCFI